MVYTKIVQRYKGSKVNSTVSYTQQAGEVGHTIYIAPLDMKGCICHFSKWQIHPFISKGTIMVSTSCVQKALALINIK